MLALTDLSKKYGGFDFGPVDLSVSNEVLTVLGPSGSGKTTLLSLIAGLVHPDTGSISLEGRSLIGRPPEERQTGLVFQDGALFPNMTARENIAYAARDTGQITDLATRFEIADVLGRRPRNLSGGERQRVALARTLAYDPDLLLLDEPLSNLDMPIRHRLSNELHELFRSLDIPIIYVTHDQRAATALGDRIAVLRDGVIEQVGTPSDILERPRTRFVASFTGSENIFEATVVDRDNGTIELQVGDVTLQTNADTPTGSVVTGSIRPSRVRLAVPDGTDVGGGENIMHGTIRRWLNESDEYRMVIDLDDAPLDLTATIMPHAFERLGVDSGAAIQVLIPSDEIHLIG